MTSISVLLYTPGRERPTLRRTLENTLSHAGLRAGDEVLLRSVGTDVVAWANAQGWSPATVREVEAPGDECVARNAMGDAAAGDLLVWLDDADLYYGNGVELLRRAADERPGHAVLAYRQKRTGERDRMVAALRSSRGNWLATAGYVKDTVARHGGLARELQAVVYMIRPFPDRW